jgi:hypothetical protein
MKVVSSLALLSAVSTLQSTFAFSVNPTAISSAAKHQTSKLSHSAQRTTSSALNMVASPIERTATAGMERGVGGRIEEAFAQAKERGEAAFVTFVTAGYPTAQGTYRITIQYDTNTRWIDGLLQLSCSPCFSPSDHY